jgi:hypothetical protein
MSTKKFALHPGYINSANDNQLHYIGIKQLERLYELKQGEYIVWNDHLKGHVWGDYLHLYPRYDGKYGRPRGY